MKQQPPIVVQYKDPTLPNRHKEWVPDRGQSSRWRWTEFFEFPQTLGEAMGVVGFRLAVPPAIAIGLSLLPTEWQVWGIGVALFLQAILILALWFLRDAVRWPERLAWLASWAMGAAIAIHYWFNVL